MSVAQLRTNEDAEPAVLDAAGLLANVRALRPALQERGEEIEQGRRLPADVVEMLRRAGAFRMMMPRAWGGPEMNPMQANEVLEELALGNAAAAWCAMIQMDSGLYSAYLNEELAHGMFGALDVSASNVLRPSGRARPVDGGYLVSGRWPFASGCLHADWFVGACLLYHDDSDRPTLNEHGAATFRMVVIRPAELVIHDTWHTTGLRGTGSNDIEADGVFVPHERSFSLHDGSSPARPGALYRWPAMLSAKMPGVVLGIARSAIETVCATLHGRKDAWEHTVLAVADAQTLYGAARAYMYGSLEALWRRLEGGEQPNEAERAAVALSRAHAFHAARQVVQLMYDAQGGAAVYSRKSVLDRHLRDINTACQHMMAQRKGQHAAAALLLGAEVPFSFI
jgi:alkylation response protein AidB-like acyl-CoA dehydrogenase